MYFSDDDSPLAHSGLFYLRWTPKRLANGPANVLLLLFVHVNSESLIGLESNWTFTVKGYGLFGITLVLKRAGAMAKVDFSLHLVLWKQQQCFSSGWQRLIVLYLCTFLWCNLQFSVPLASHVLFTTERGFESNACTRCNHLKPIRPKRLSFYRSSSKIYRSMHLHLHISIPHQSLKRNGYLFGALRFLVKKKNTKTCFLKEYLLQK